MNSLKLTDISRYVYGTTRLGDDSISWDDRKAIAREALSGCGWIHTSHQYGDALKLLGEVYSDDRSLVRPTIFKIGWSSVDEVKGQIDLQLTALGVNSMAIGQLCPGGELADAVRTGGPALDGLRALKAEGLVERFVMEVWPWTSDVPLGALRGGHFEGLVDGLIFYLNPLQRLVTNELWDLILSKEFPIIAMRTVAGGDIRRLAVFEGSRSYIHDRAAEVLPIFERSGIESWAEFSARFSLGLPLVRATVGATSRHEGLVELQRVTADPHPLPNSITEEILALQTKWSDEYDVHAAAWTM